MKRRTAELENIKASDVLAILRNSHARQCLCDPEADPDISLSMTSTVRDWREACDLVPWKPLGNGMNESFIIQHSENEWRDVLEPAKTKTLQGVCELIAQTATRAKITPYSIGGTKSEEAGIFIAITTTLKRYGWDIDIRPSTPLTKDNAYLIVDVLGKIAPDIFLSETYEYTSVVSTCKEILRNTLSLIIFCGFAVGILNIFFSMELHIITLVIMLLSLFLANIIADHIPHSRLHVGEQETVGDVCRLVAKMPNQNT
ncbi:MAG: hypothetical protein KGV50_02255 [Gammaproteobacteria bacterium]|nr:hypothetical protein [Gammaproteobacteria bacterium]